jgi:hypothetical protein
VLRPLPLLVVSNSLTEPHTETPLYDHDIASMNSNPAVRGLAGCTKAHPTDGQERLRCSGAPLLPSHTSLVVEDEPAIVETLQMI